MVRGLVTVRVGVMFSVGVIECMGTPRFLVSGTVCLGQHCQLRQGGNPKLTGILTSTYLRIHLTIHQIIQQPYNNQTLCTK